MVRYLVFAIVASVGMRLTVFFLFALASALDAPGAPDADTMAELPTDPKTLSQMLQWSLDHTDLNELHQKAESIRSASSKKTLSPDGNENSLDAMPNSLPRPVWKSVDQDPEMRERLRELSEISAALMPDQVKYRT